VFGNIISYFYSKKTIAVAAPEEINNVEESLPDNVVALRGSVEEPTQFEEPRIEFNPQKNITAYELSLVITGLVITASKQYLNDHPELKRHFED